MSFVGEDGENLGSRPFADKFLAKDSKGLSSIQISSSVEYWNALLSRAFAGGIIRRSAFLEAAMVAKTDLTKD